MKLAKLFELEFILWSCGTVIASKRRKFDDSIYNSILLAIAAGKDGFHMHFPYLQPFSRANRSGGTVVRRSWWQGPRLPPTAGQSRGTWIVLDGEAAPWQFAALRLCVFLE
jgi:hypothetical protein